MKRPKGVTFLGYSFMFMAYVTVNTFIQHPEMVQKRGLLALSVTNLLIFVTLCVSLLKMQSWSRWLCIAVCALSLLLVPSIVVAAHGNWLTLIPAGLRTLFCVWGVWYLSQPHVKAAFRGAKQGGIAESELPSRDLSPVKVADSVSQFLGRAEERLSAFTSCSSSAAMKFSLLGLIVLAILVLTALYFYRGRVSTMSADHAASARKVADVHTIGVSLDINAERSLFLLLSADGSINRQGSGTLKNKNPDLFIGKTDPAIFESVRSHLTEAMLQRVLGHTFQDQNPRGAPCKLEVTLFFKDGTSAGGFAFLYGSESEGPPRDVRDLVMAAVRETESWYQQQLRMVSGG